jgi:hypothetical protein
VSPEILSIILSYAWASLVAFFLLIGIAVRLSRALAIVTGSTSLFAAAVCGLAAPQNLELQFAAYGFAAAGTVVGSVCAVVVIAECWRDRAKTRTAV